MHFEDWRADQDTIKISTDWHEFEIAYREVGTDGPVTVFLHGIPTWGYLYRDVCAAPSHAILPDLPGYGFTRHLSDGGYDRSVRAQTEYVLEFIDELGLDSVQLVAHDIGGAVAMRIAIETDLVDRLVLSNVTSFDSWPIEPILQLGLPDCARNTTYKEVADTLRGLFAGSERLYDENSIDETFVDGMVEPFLDRPVTDLARNAIATNTNHTLELVSRLDEITCPTLLLWGVPGSKQHVGYANRLADHIPNTEQSWLRGSYHWVMQECAEQYRAELSRFLD